MKIPKLKIGKKYFIVLKDRMWYYFKVEAKQSTSKGTYSIEILKHHPDSHANSTSGWLLILGQENKNRVIELKSGKEAISRMLLEEL